jgi:hypothetical protein
MPNQQVLGNRLEMPSSRINRDSGFRDSLTCTGLRLRLCGIDGVSIELRRSLMARRCRNCCRCRRTDVGGTQSRVVPLSER